MTLTAIPHANNLELLKERKTINIYLKKAIKMYILYYIY